MRTITDIAFNGQGISKMPSPERYADQGPYYPIVHIRPELGMQVNVWHWRTSVGDHRDEAIPVETGTKPGMGATFGGAGIVTAVRYKPGRSGTLYPYVDVEVEEDEARRQVISEYFRELGARKTEAKSASSSANMARARAASLTDAARAKRSEAQKARRRREQEAKA